MLQIRDAQLHALREAAARAFGRELAAHLRRRFPDRTAGLDDGALAAFVERQMRAAARLGATFEHEIRLFAECAAWYGEDFLERDDTAWARDFLVVARLSASQRFALLARFADLGGEAHDAG